jgi:hypothetical protein
MVKVLEVDIESSQLVEEAAVGLRPSPPDSLQLGLAAEVVVEVEVEVL